MASYQKLAIKQQVKTLETSAEARYWKKYKVRVRAPSAAVGWTASESLVCGCEPCSVRGLRRRVCWHRTHSWRPSAPHDFSPTHPGAQWTRRGSFNSHTRLTPTTHLLSLH